MAVYNAGDHRIGAIGAGVDAQPLGGSSLYFVPINAGDNSLGFGAAQELEIVGTATVVSNDTEIFANTLHGTGSNEQTFNLTNCTMNITSATVAPGAFQQFLGTLNWENVTLQYFTEGGNALNWGVFNSGATLGAGEEAGIWNINNLNLHGRGRLAFNTGDSNIASNIRNVSLWNGLQDATLTRGSYWEPSAAPLTDLFFGPYGRARTDFVGGATGLAFMRQVATAGLTLANNWTYIAQADFSGLTTLDTALGSGANNYYLIADGTLDQWIVNPFAPNYAGGTTNRARAGAATTVVSQSRIVHAWRPTFTTDVPANNDFRVHTNFGANAAVMNRVPAAYTGLGFDVNGDVAPAVRPAVLTGIAHDVEAVGFDGFFIEDSSSLRSTALSTTETGVEILNPPDRTFRFTSFRHVSNFEQVTVNYPDPGETVVNTVKANVIVNTITGNNLIWNNADNRTRDIDIYVRDYLTAAAVPTTAASIDDLYPGIKSNWYTNNRLYNLPVVGSLGTTITFSANAIISSTAATSAQADVNTGSLTISAATTLTAGLTSTLIADASTLSLGVVTYPAGMTFGISNGGRLQITGTGFGAGTRISGTVRGATAAQLNDPNTIWGTSDVTVTDTGTVDITDSTLEGRVSIFASAPLTVRVLDTQDGALHTNGYTAGNANVTIAQIPGARRVYQVPAAQRNGVFGVRNMSTNVNIVPPVVIDPNVLATYSFTVDSSQFPTDVITAYWKPEATATEGYNITILTLETAVVTEETINLLSSRIPATLWENVVGLDAVNTTTATAVIVDGDVDFGSIDRARINYDSMGLLADNLTGGSRSLFITFRASSISVEYLRRIMDNELTADIVTTAGTEVILDTRYIYIDTANETVQQTVTAVTPLADPQPVGGEILGRRAVDNTGILGGGIDPVIRLFNPAGATAGQVAAAVALGVPSGVAASPEIQQMHNGLGWIISDGNDATTVGTTANTLATPKPGGRYVRLDDYTTIFDNETE